MAQATAIALTKVNTFLAKVYLSMFVGLAVTGVISYWIAKNTAVESPLLTNPWLGWDLLILQIVVLTFLSARVRKAR